MSNSLRTVERCLHEVVIEPTLASGPGGQNVNKVSTAVQLRFDVAGSRHLDAGAKRRLCRLAGRRATSAGTILIRAGSRRTQSANRRDGLRRLRLLLEAALRPPKRRRPTEPTAASRERRLRAKKARGDVKRLRREQGD